MKSFQADYVFPGNTPPIKNGIVTVDEVGKIIAVTEQVPITEHHQVPVEKLTGIICPGFINTHCHLELSHLKGKIEKGTGLVNFIKNVQKFRNIEKAEMLEAATIADNEMFDNGIVAVGDISNSNLTISVKQESKLYYHTFVETFGFLPGQADTIFNRALSLRDDFRPLSCSVTPHAPYSVSKELFKLIKNECETGNNLISIHNQECEDENKFFRYKKGTFNNLYESFGIDISHFKAKKRNSLQSILPLLTGEQQILFVHNTFTNLKDIEFVEQYEHKINWCFCPNANLYIESTVPRVELFLGQGFNITIGTDSLASNDGLSILGEMLCLQQKFPSLTTARLVEWATAGGARYLGIDDKTGTLEAGKTPGLNLLTGTDGLNLTAETKVKRLV
jgi:cytosine/adenosine deaminase-related metal-dependent hydrolase